MTSESRYAVCLHDRKIGTLFSRENYTRFLFDNAYIQDPDRAVLGLRFEEDLHAAHRSKVRLPPWFSNLLPEGHLRQWVADARGVSKTREIELLLELGHDLPGAVRVTQEEAPGLPRQAEGEVDSESPPVAEEAIWRFSLAGVAMKFSMLQQNDRFTAPAAGDGGDWIVKLPDRTYPQVPLNEHAMMEWARAAGLDVPETTLIHRDQLEDIPDSLWPKEEQRAYAIRRFDRHMDGSRTHMEDLAQVRGFYPDQKYQGAFETVGALVYRSRDVTSLVEFCKRLAFNVLIRNGDAHLKNWSLLYTDPRRPKLSPVYDLVATSVYSPSGDPEDLGLKFLGSRRFETVSSAQFSRLQRKLRAQGVDLADEVRRFVRRAHEVLPQITPLISRHDFLVKGITQDLKARVARLLS